MNKALFLDRDGVINVEKNYVYRIEDFEFVEGIFETLKFFQEKGYLLVIITNQAGIGRGYYTEDDFQTLTQWMLENFKSRDIVISKVLHCPFHPVHGIGLYKKDSYDRKPNPGMLIKAQKELNIDLSNSILVGDKISDIECGIKAGVERNYLINSLQIDYENSKYKIIANIKELMLIG